MLNLDAIIQSSFAVLMAAFVWQLWTNDDKPKRKQEPYVTYLMKPDRKTRRDDEHGTARTASTA